MKLLIVPDVHGIEDWQHPVNIALKDKDTHIVFLGDYVDSFVIPGWAILNNLKNIIELKKLFPTKITLLLGNHDYAYVFGKTRISGFNSAMWFDYRDIINKNWDLFDLAWGFKEKNSKYNLFTHAGLTQHFYNKIVAEINNVLSPMHILLVEQAEIHWSKLQLHKLLNYFKDQVGLMWTIGFIRKGQDLSGSIIWADKTELCKDPYKGINQFIGHTNYYTYELYCKNDDYLYFIDAHTDYHLTCFYIELD